MTGKSNSWKKIRLGDVVKITHGWPFKSDQYSEERLGRPIVVSIGNFDYTGGFRFGSTTIKEYAGEYPKEYELTPGDVLMIMTCQTAGGEILGIPGRIPKDGNTYLHNQRMGKVIPLKRDEIDLGFVYYLALWKPFNQHLFASSSGTKIVHTSPGRIESFEFSLPPLPEQKAIARILGALDDKIELNRRMNTTLEAMARALYQSWFVDFDPVHVLAGTQPEQPPFLSAEVLAQAGFPNSFQDSELGPIPKGWSVKMLGDIADVNWGDTKTTKKSYTHEGFTAYSAAGPDGLLPHHDFDRIGVVVSAIGSAGLSWLAVGKWSCIKNTIRFWATQSGVSTEYLYQFTKGQERWPKRGSVQPFISQGDARAMRIIVPANDLGEFYGSMVRSWISQIEANKRQIGSLACLRDTLLPKLLSGEINPASPNNEKTL